MYELIAALYTRGFHTIASCQADPQANGWPVVTFVNPAHLQRLVSICTEAAQGWGDYDFYGRITEDHPDTGTYLGEDLWKIRARIANPSVFSPATPGLHPIMMTIAFPPEDLSKVVRAVLEFAESLQGQDFDQEHP